VAQPHSVVIIEDDGDLRGLVAAVLSQAGYRVDATGDSCHGVDLVRHENPDLILCDIGMPDMDGYAVVRALQDDPATRRVPVAFLTARREFTDRVRAFRYGVVDYITKPFDAETLLSRIDGILDSRAHEGTDDATILEDRATPRMLREAELGALQQDIADHDPAELAGLDFGDVPAALRDIVIADHDVAFRSTLAGVFARHRFQVREEGDGMEAVRRILERPPSVLLLDVRLPVLDGFAVCRRLRGYSLTRHLPIVFLSGFDGLESRIGGMEAGANEFLSKRTSLRELLLRVQLQLQRYRRSPGDGDAALRGRIDVLGAPGVLQMCFLTGLTGTLTATDGRAVVAMGFEAGRLVTADGRSSRGREAVFDFVAWERGTFEFADGLPCAGTPVTEPVTALVLEGCRRTDQRGPSLLEAPTP
jgi:DNA-binding response OmpR family regulator